MMTTNHRRLSITNVATAVCILNLLSRIGISEGATTDQVDSHRAHKNSTKAIINRFQSMGTPPKVNQSMDEIISRYDVDSVVKIKPAGSRMLNMLWSSVKRLVHHVMNHVGEVISQNKDPSKVINKVVNKVKNRVKDYLQPLLESLAKEGVKKAAVLGNLLIKSLRGTEYYLNQKTALAKLGLGKMKKIISDTVNLFEGNWENVKAMDFPGKDLLLMTYPSGLVSMFDQISGELCYMIDHTHKHLTSSLATTIYVSTKVIVSAVEKVLGQIKPCVRLKPMRMTVNKNMIGKVENSQLCGVNSLTPVNNAVLTRNDHSFLVIEMPWKLDNLEIKYNAVNVTGKGGYLVDDHSMNIHINKINATGTVTFQAGMILRFIKIHMHFDDLSRMKFEFTRPKTSLMDMVESMSGSMKRVVKNEINRVLDKVEKEISDYICNLGTSG